MLHDFIVYATKNRKNGEEQAEKTTLFRRVAHRFSLGTDI
jgi:hypothetical protein